MRHLILSLIASVLIPIGLSASDAELEEKLKAVMILFDKSQQGLKEEIESLELQVAHLEDKNEQLARDLEIERSLVLQLKADAIVRESQNLDQDSPNSVVAQELVAANSEFAEFDQTPGPRGGGRGNRGQGRQGGGARQEPIENLPVGDLININTATKDELMTLPLINDFNADNIIAGRPWETLEDLIQLQGFGPMKLRRLQPFATTAGPMEELEETAETIESPEPAPEEEDLEIN